MRVKFTFPAALALLASTCAHAQSPADRPAAMALGGEPAGAAAATMVPTNLPGVYAFTQAPPGFDPDTAAPGELARYGYPSRPDVADGPEALAAWRMATAPHRKRVVPALLRTNRYHLPMTVVSVTA